MCWSHMLALPSAPMCSLTFTGPGCVSWNQPNILWTNKWFQNVTVLKAMIRTIWRRNYHVELGDKYICPSSFKLRLSYHRLCNRHVYITRLHGFPLSFDGSRQSLAFHKTLLWASLHTVTCQTKARDLLYQKKKKDTNPFHMLWYFM